MPWKRIVMTEPPNDATMNGLEAQGWSKISVVGPALGKAEGDEQPRPVYLIYLWRSVILAGADVLPPLGKAH